MQLLPKLNNLTLIEKMVDDGHFLFIYNSNKIKKDKKDFPKLK